MSLRSSTPKRCSEGAEGHDKDPRPSADIHDLSEASGEPMRPAAAFDSTPSAAPLSRTGGNSENQRPEPAGSEELPAPVGDSHQDYLFAVVQAQREIMALIARGASLKQVLTNIALITERILGSGLCSVHLVEPGGKFLLHHAAPNLPAALAMATEAVEIREDNGPIAAAAFRRQTVCIDDMEVDPVGRYFSQFAGRYGLRACLVQPVLGPQSDLLGALTVYFSQPREDTKSTSHVLELAASLVEFAVAMDLRDRSRRFADERFTSLAATIPGVVYQRVVTPEGDIRYTYISEGAKDLFGVSPEEILADPEALFVCHGPEYRESFRQRLITASRNLELWDVEAQIITRDGEEKWTHAIARPHAQPDGSVIWDGIILDATRIKKAELELRKAKDDAEASNRAYSQLLQKLRSANQRFTSLAETIPGVVYQRVVTPDGDIRYTYISEGAKDLFGVSPDEILADPQALFDCHGPQYRTDFRERLIEASKNLELWDVEAQIISRDGQEKWTHAIARPHRQGDGSVVWDGVILNATRIKKAELELRQAKEAAEALSQAKSRFLARMGHELRTPLNSIIGFSDILTNQYLGPLGHADYIEYASLINKSGTHLLELINDILDFTEYETGALELRKGPVNLLRVIDSAVRQIAGIAESAGVRVIEEIDANLPIVLADERRLAKILMSLLSNAVKFTDRHNEITIDATVDATENVVITVSDTGIGIAQENMATLFEPFGQVDGDLDRKYEGIGLGIPLAVSMAKLHQASLTFISDEGQGTKAILVLPKELTVESDRGSALTA